MRTIKIFSVIALATMVMTSCRETVREEKVVRESRVEEKEGVLERTAKKMDREVNEEVNEEINKIGDDN